MIFTKHPLHFFLSQKISRHRLLHFASNNSPFPVHAAFHGIADFIASRRVHFFISFCVIHAINSSSALVCSTVPQRRLSSEHNFPVQALAILFLTSVDPRKALCLLNQWKTSFRGVWPHKERRQCIHLSGSTARKIYSRNQRSPVMSLSKILVILQNLTSISENIYRNQQNQL